MPLDAVSRPEGVGRRGRGLSRDKIVETGLVVVDRDGLDALTMRRLAAELGVEAMSLYKYFRNKTALLEAIGEEVVREIELPPEEENDWVESLRLGCRAFYRTLLAHPNAIPLVVASPLISGASLDASERVLRELSRIGIDPAAAHQLFRMLQALTFGSALMVAERPGSAAVRDQTREIDRFEETYPLLSAALPSVEKTGPSDDFELGLDLVLEALNARSRSAG